MQPKNSETAYQKVWNPTSNGFLAAQSLACSNAHYGFSAVACLFLRYLFFQNWVQRLFEWSSFQPIFILKVLTSRPPSVFGEDICFHEIQCFLWSSVLSAQRKLDIKEFLVFMTPFGREQAASMWTGIEDKTCLTSINLPAGVSNLPTQPSIFFRN